MDRRDWQWKYLSSRRNPKYLDEKWSKSFKASLELHSKIGKKKQHPFAITYIDNNKYQDKCSFSSLNSANGLKRHNRHGCQRQGHFSTNSVEDDLKLPWLTVFLGTTFADFLLKPIVKVIVILLYLAGLGTAIYGCFNLQQGTDPKNLVSDESYYHDFLTRLQHDFDEITSPTIMVGFKDALNYTDPSARDDIDRFFGKLQSSKYFYDEEYYIFSWLFKFEDYLVSTNRDVNQLNMPQFIHILQNEFFPMAPFEKYVVDVDVNYANTAIENSRMLIKSKKIYGITEEVALMNFVRERAEQSSLNIEVFSSVFIYGDQYNSVLSTTLISFSIATGSILLVSLFFIPSITTAVWITLATISIYIYTIGFMVHWDVNLDAVIHGKLDSIDRFFG